MIKVSISASPESSTSVGTPEWIIGRDLAGIAEGRPRLVLEGDAIAPHRNRDASHEGRVVLADQEHGSLSRGSSSNRRKHSRRTSMILMKPKRTTFCPCLSLLASVRRHGIITVWLFSTVDVGDMITAE